MVPTTFLQACWCLNKHNTAATLQRLSSRHDPAVERKSKRQGNFDAKSCNTPKVQRIFQQYSESPTYPSDVSRPRLSRPKERFSSMVSFSAALEGKFLCWVVGARPQANPRRKWMNVGQLYVQSCTSGFSYYLLFSTNVHWTCGPKLAAKISMLLLCLVI